MIPGWGSPGGASGKKKKKKKTLREKNSGNIRHSGRCPGGGHGNPLQYSCLENHHGQRSLADTELDTTEVT